MLSSKFVGIYLKEVTSWQKKLSNAEQVIATWAEVQRIWRYLESIFSESEDIRKTLPEDTKLFDQSDSLFRVSYIYIVIINKFIYNINNNIDLYYK